MATVETPFVIAVIREREKYFLGEAEYTRLIEAPDAPRALHVLVETPYGEWINDTTDSHQVFLALTKHLLSVREWLHDLVDQPKLLQFMAARYDALNVATALIEKKQGNPEPGELSPLGAIAVSVIQSTIWNDVGWEYLPQPWATYIAQELKGETANATSNWQGELLQRAQHQALAWMASLATTPLAREVVALYRDRLLVDSLLRGYSHDDAPQTPLEHALHTTEATLPIIFEALQAARYTTFTLEQLQEVSAHTAAVQYEKAWDEELLQRISAWRHEPVGYDPILAFWLAKELEVKNVRILLLAKINQLRSEELRHLQRSAYGTRV